MFKNFYSITFLVIFSLFFSACQNSSPVGIVPDPAGGGVCWGMFLRPGRRNPASVDA